MHSRIEAEIHKAGEQANTNRDIALAREAKRRAEKEAKQQHENSTNRDDNVPRNEHENSTNQTPDTRHHINQEQTHTVETNTSVEPTLAASVCLELKKLNYLDINPSHPRLLSMLNAGATLEEFVNAAQTVKVKKFVYVMGAVEGMRKQAAAENVTQGNFAEVAAAKAWRNNESMMVAKAKELGIGTQGLSKFDLIAKIDAKIERQRAA